MTAERAVELLEKIKRGSVATLHSRSGIDALEIAIKALERQIPKKPSEVNESEYDRFYCVDFMCDTCNTAVIGQPYRPKHCKHCGQALDWSK